MHCFFILSGFVIQLAIKQSSSQRFLIQRAFRIYPTFWVSMFAALLLALVSGRVNWLGTGSLTDFLLMKDTPLNPVVWTLVIEVRYYVVVAILYAVGLRYSATTAIFAVGLVACAALEAFGAFPGSGTFRITLSLFFFLAWLHTGALIFEIWSSHGSERAHAVRVFAVHLILFVSSFLLLSSGTPFGRATEASLNSSSMSPALLTVAALAFANQYFSTPVAAFKYLGDISYPLYVLHMPVGWFVFTLVFERVGIAAAVLIGVLSVFLASALVHSVIEAPANRFGKLLRASPGRGPNELAEKELRQMSPL